MSSKFARAVRINEIEPYDYSVLIIGETGAGKSTLINTIVNSVLETDLENLRAAIKCEKYPKIDREFDDGLIERNDSATGISQTMNIHFYKVSSPLTKDKTFLIVDTPGISSSGGIDEDDENINKIIIAARTVKKFNAILFIQQYSTNRITAAFKYKVARIAEVIPTDFETSVIMILSFALDEKRFLSDDHYHFPIKNTFFINNSHFGYNKEDYAKNSVLKKKQSINKEESDCKVGEIFQYIFSMNAQINKQYHELFVYHNNIMNKISEFKAHLKNIEKIKLHFDTKKEIIITDWEKTLYHNTICTKHLVVCHEVCHLNFCDFKNSKYFNDCFCMNFEKICKVCGCISEFHVHKHEKPKNKVQTIQEVFNIYSIPYDLTNRDGLINKIELKEIEIARELLNFENEISKVNPRYKISKRVRKIVKFLDQCEYGDTNFEKEKFLFQQSLYEDLKGKFNSLK